MGERDQQRDQRSAAVAFADRADAYVETGHPTLAIGQLAAAVRCLAGEARGDASAPAQAPAGASREALLRAIGRWADLRERGANHHETYAAHLAMLHAIDAFELQLRGRS